MSTIDDRLPPWDLECDLEDILAATTDIWPRLKGARLFISGGTGFIGCWLLESLRHADQKLGLGIGAMILTRDPERFKLRFPHLGSYPAFEFVAGNVLDFVSPAGEFSHVIHAATDASAALNENNPLQMFDTTILGTRRMLDFAIEKRPDRVLNLSSGAVYGQQPRDMEHVPETCLLAPDCTEPRNAYAEGKRAAEMLWAIAGKQHGLSVSTARIFALLGPYLALDIHFAAGNFIRDAMAGQPIIIKGDGSPRRSYLYAGDLTVWLWHLLVRGAPQKAYNVGSDESVSIRELAERISATLGAPECRVLGARDMGWNTGRYVPDTCLAGAEFNLYKTVSLEDAILRTALWNGWKSK
jgi:dTDP-glucose 4,6-dehydratase